jgi:hypothetical protein
VLRKRCAVDLYERPVASAGDLVHDLREQALAACPSRP